MANRYYQDYTGKRKAHREDINNVSKFMKFSCPIYEKPSEYEQNRRVTLAKSSPDFTEDIDFESAGDWPSESLFQQNASSSNSVSNFIEDRSFILPINVTDAASSYLPGATFSYLPDATFSYLPDATSSYLPDATSAESDLNPTHEENRPISEVFQGFNQGDRAFMDLFIRGVQQQISRYKNNAENAIAAVAIQLDCLNDIRYMFRDDPESLKGRPLFFCDLSVKSIVVSSGCSKKKTIAKMVAAEQCVNEMFRTSTWIKNKGDSYPFDKSEIKNKRCGRGTRGRRSKNNFCEANDASNAPFSLPPYPPSEEINKPTSEVFKGLNPEQILFLDEFIRMVKIAVVKRSLSAFIALGSAAARLNCANDVHYAYREDPDRVDGQQYFFCDLFLKTIALSSGWSTAKKHARRDAAEQAVNAMFRTSTWVKEKEQHLPFPIEPTIRGETLISNRKLKMLKAAAKRDQAIKDFVSSSAPSVLPGASYTTVIGKLTDSSSKGKYANYVTFKPMPATAPRLFVLNNELFENSLAKEFILIDRAEVGTTFQQTPASVIDFSAIFCKKKSFYSMQQVPAMSGKPACFRSTIFVGEMEISSAEAAQRGEAKSESAFLAVEKLKKYVYTLKFKNFPPDYVIHRHQVDGAELPFPPSAGCKLLKMIGWSGGGIGHIDPVVKTRGPEFGVVPKLEAIIKDYSTMDTCGDIIFSTDFLKNERKHIFRLAMQYKLLCKTNNSTADKYIYMRKKIPFCQMLDTLKREGGSNQMYELVDRSQENQFTSL